MKTFDGARGPLRAQGSALTRRICCSCFIRLQRDPLRIHMRQIEWDQGDARACYHGGFDDLGRLTRSRGFFRAQGYVQSHKGSLCIVGFSKFFGPSPRKHRLTVYRGFQVQPGFALSLSGRITCRRKRSWVFVI